jgi:large subunit ribosomal protein L18
MNIKKRKKRIFSKIFGTFQKPRLSIFCSNNHFYAQVIDDINQKTLVSFSSLKLKSDKFTRLKLNCSLSKLVGVSLAENMLNKNFKKIVFDRNGKLYHGKVQVFAESLRANGINF